MNGYSLAHLDYINPRTLNILKKNGIETVGDLLTYYPHRYDDYTITPFLEAVPEETVTIQGFVQSRPTVTTLRGNLNVMNFFVEVDGFNVRVAIFNRHFLKNKINFKEYVRLTGKFDLTKRNFTASEISFDEFSSNIQPRYNIKGIKDEKFHELVSQVYYDFRDKIQETLPEELLVKHNLLSLDKAIKYIHLPEKMTETKKALRRLKYEELLTYQINVKYMLYKRKSEHQGVAIPYDEVKVKEFIDNLEFTLTPDQEKAVEEILCDIRSNYKMNRLLQGEVGSGKTIVAAIALYAVVSANYQGAIMVPTEVLANQHYETFLNYFKNYNVNISLLTSSISQKERTQILRDLANGKINIIIGTHALFQKDVVFHNLGLVVTDEEHRFGVRQRVSIVGKGYLIDHLKMSATPIPRTLALSFLGDSDISILKTLPGNRKETITEYIEYQNRHKVFEHIAEQVKQGRQVYIITPMIEDSESMDLSNALEVYENTKKYYRGIAEVGLIHGRLKAEEKQEIMEKFARNEIQILVATSVIEVGVNVVNATNIIILDADRFGIAQLHQMRGRVRRGDYQSYCFLISKATQESTVNRLKLVAEISDGFVLAEEDLKNRGPGDFFGEKQSGNVMFKLADLVEDAEIFEIANEDAEEIMNSKKLFILPEYQYLFQQAEENYQMKKEMLE